jgi:hypothetical protein
LANLTKIRREKTQTNEIRNEKGEIRKKETPRKPRQSLRTTLKTYIQINWKI